MAQEIGAAYKGGTGDMDYVAHKIAHAALGGAMDIAMGGDGVSGAIGGVVGEITAEALADELLQKYDAGELSYDDLVEWQDKGVNISRLVAGLAATVVGGDVDAAAEAGGNAAENNAFVTMLVVAYAKLVGKGDPVKGAAIIGNGDDPLSVAMEDALATGVAKGVELGYENYPEATEQAVQALVWLDGTVDATVTYLDEATGQYVSKAWNSLDYDTQGLLKASGKTLGLTLSFSGGAVAALAKTKKVASVAKAVDAVLPDSVKEAKIIEAIANAGKKGLTTFKGDAAVLHFEKHGAELMKAFGKHSYNIKDYIEDANHVIAAGRHVPELNGFVKLIGGTGSAKYAFVGIDRTSGAISTFHIKTVSELAKKAPSLGLNK